MLKQLTIKNFTLIDSLDIKFNAGFSVITGETGAGKSIILGAIGMLLGQRADTKAIKSGAGKCVIEAHFDLSRYGLESIFEQYELEYDPEDCIIRRELTATGKSRAFINDTPTTLPVLKEIGEKLVDVHSQHQNLLLNKQDFQLEVIDTIACDDSELSKYKADYAAYMNCERALKDLTEETERNKMNADFIKFQYEELCNAKLVDGEQEELEQKADTMSHSEEIKSALYEADNALSADVTGAVENVRSAVSALRNIAQMLPDASEMTDRLSTVYIELKDISQEISPMLESIEFNPAELESVNNRIDKIYDLEKKYHCDTIGGLIKKREELGRQLDNIENSDDALRELQEKLNHAKQECTASADLLSKIRHKAAKKIEEEMSKRLTPLGMPNVRFQVNMEKEQLGRNGHDKVSFLFSANKNSPLQPVAQVASGGEIARVMLSLKAMISGAVKLPTIIFDEIDTGVSGKIAEKMAQIMQQMGRDNRQVISITHLPQIAALGQTHYKVYKEESDTGTISRMKQLTDEERIKEIAQMLSGSDVTAAAINNAKELLKL